MMDLGATICRPKDPDCPACPLAGDCRACASGDPEAYPAPKAKRLRPHKHGIAWWTERSGSVWLVRRPAKGMLGGMAALPGPEWGDKPPAIRALATVSHSFTHFTLDLHIVARAEPAIDGWWQPLDRLAEAGLPTLYRKAVEATLSRKETLPPDPFFRRWPDRADHLRADRTPSWPYRPRAEAVELMWDNGARQSITGQLRWEQLPARRHCSWPERRASASHLPEGDAPVDARSHFQLLSLSTPTKRLPCRRPELANWHRRHRHCSVCGQATEPNRGGWSRKCGSCEPNYSAGRFAVIMLAEHEGRLLLAASRIIHRAAIRRWPASSNRGIDRGRGGARTGKKKPASWCAMSATYAASRGPSLIR
jgi:hypothetical protein